MGRRDVDWSQMPLSNQSYDEMDGMLEHGRAWVKIVCLLTCLVGA